ncbi:MAG: thiamine phosphate synthase [Gammaproteobacteria bacterium]|nr:thiamine phosphate synthase [Gammaproteobacteria bacterium]MBT8134865.1 thiamine phosphate synthase [Gammaproteobacteria bacterium]NNJ51454.1 thiamine phosphate synthase [Gammaproteobacteria bacterium]
MTTVPGATKDRLKGLYAITDENLIAEEKFSETIEAALMGGASIIQYRDKSSDPTKRLHQAATLRELCNKYGATFIINDDIGLAKTVTADGVHLGRDDTALASARQELGEDAIIGISCYDDIGLAITAEQNSADYVAFGTMFSSPTKPDAVCAGPDTITQARKQLNIPICAIGGINESNILQLVNHHTDMAAVISSLFAADDIQQRARLMSQYFI